MENRIHTSNSASVGSLSMVVPAVGNLASVLELAGGSWHVGHGFFESVIEVTRHDSGIGISVSVDTIAPLELRHVGSEGLESGEKRKRLMMGRKEAKIMMMGMGLVVRMML